MTHNIQNRLRGIYAVGPIMEDGNPEMGYREFKLPDCSTCGRAGIPQIQLEAADYIDDLEAKIEQLGDIIENHDLNILYNDQLNE